MPKTFAIHSPNNAEILIRIHDDLVKAGYSEEPRDWVKNLTNPWLLAYLDKILRFRLSNYEPFNDDCVRFLNESNYSEILKEIIDNQH